MKSNYNVDLIIQTIVDGESMISNAFERDLIIFLGPSQVGKSTLINALLGVEFELQDDDSLRPREGNEVIAPIGDLRNGGISVTQLPKTYANDSNFCFLDTQGFFDLSENNEMNIASSILLEIAVAKAKSVRIVNLCKCDDFINGLVTFHKIGQQLSQIITCDTEPIYFLFNRFHVPHKIGPQFYRMNESQQRDFIKKRLEESYHNMLNGKKELVKQLIKTRNNDLKVVIEEEEEELSDLTSDNNLIQMNDVSNFISNANNNIIMIGQDFDFTKTFDESNDKYKYTSFIENCFSRNYYGYISPESIESIAEFLQNISKFPVINKNCLAFNCMTERRIFDRIFINEINKEIKYIKKIKFAMKYTEERIVNLINQIQTEIKSYETLQNKKEVASDFLGQIQINDELDKLINEKMKIDAELIHLINGLNDFIDSPPVPFWEKSWDIGPGVLLWRNYVCKYDDGIPFVKIDEVLDGTTSRYNVIDINSPHFEVVYSSKGNIKTILSNVSINNTNLYTEFRNNRCKGKVVLYTEKRYLEPNTIPVMQEEITNTQEIIRGLSTSIESSLNKNYEEQIQQIISEKQHQVEILGNYQKIVRKVKSQWIVENDKKTLYSKYNNLILNIYNTSSFGSFNEFIRLYSSILPGEIVFKDFPLSFYDIHREYQSIFSKDFF